MEDFLMVFTLLILSLLGVVIASAVAYLTPKIKNRIETLIAKDDTGIIEVVSDMAVELIEKELKGEKGEEKFNAAIEYATKILNRYGIKESSEFVAGAIQSGWRRMNEKQKEDK